ncbi:unnamed protein product [Tilletia caries]|nr:unnamed protein product [Tilletia caries]CAD6925181.1 unnamed protein product [Tilletia caries]
MERHTALYIRHPQSHQPRPRRAQSAKPLEGSAHAVVDPVKVRRQVQAACIPGNAQVFVALNLRDLSAVHQQVGRSPGYHPALPNVETQPMCCCPFHRRIQQPLTLRFRLHRQSPVIRKEHSAKAAQLRPFVEQAHQAVDDQIEQFRGDDAALSKASQERERLAPLIVHHQYRRRSNRQKRPYQTLFREWRASVGENLYDEQSCERGKSGKKVEEDGNVPTGVSSLVVCDQS